MTADTAHLHDHTLAWPRTRRARALLLAVAVVTLLLNALGWVTSIVGVNTALLVAAVGAYPLALRVRSAIVARRITYDVTIAVAALIAALAGEFLAAAEVILIVLAGDALEHWAMHRADRAIAGLMSLQPDHAAVVRDGRELSVAATEIRLSDRVIVRSGERIPVDGLVIDGEASVDQALVTGESTPAAKSGGARVYSGTIVQHGAIDIRPELVGEDTTLARIGRLVRDARRRRASIVRGADRLAQWFLPAILLSAVLVYLLTGQALRSAAVLLVACSCALVYAAPAAFAAALARLAREGVLVKGGDALESLSQVTAVVFDKTGTLTAGHPSVTDVAASASFGPDEILRLAASVEQRSEHAFGRAIVVEAERRQLTLSGAEAFAQRPGLGVTGRIASRTIAVGSPVFAAQTAPAATADIDSLRGRCGRAGDTHIVVLVEGEAAGVIALHDQARPDAARAIQAIRQLGIRNVYLLTGDEQAVAEAVAGDVGIEVEFVAAEQLPERKLERIRALGADGTRVLMVGDGINDAPSLAAAHVGAAFGRGAADLSAEAAQVVVLEPRLDAIPEAIAFARKTVKRVRFNIMAFALGVNVAAILAAAAGVLTPAGSALLHQFVSLAVILSSVSLIVEHRVRDPKTWEQWGQGLVISARDWWVVPYATLREMLFRHRRAIARSAALAAAVFWLSTGVVVVGPAETGAVLRFGRLVDAHLQPGLHLRAPWPIESVTRLAPRRVRVLELGFRSPARRSAGPIDLEWNTTHGEGDVQQVADENLVLTGDENMSELYAVVHFEIADPARYLFNVRDGDAVVRMMAEGVLRNLAAGYSLDRLLTTDRHRLEEAWADGVRARLASVGAGVDLLGIHLADVHPPVEVVEAFRDVASAEEERVMRVNESDAYAKEAIPLARGGAQAQLEQAAGYRASRVAQADGDAARFAARIAGIVSLPLTMFRLQMETVDAVLSGKRITITDEHRGGRRTLVFVGDADLLKFIGGKPPAGLYDEEER
jgi:Cu+-exporting ATPase